jgi:protein-tyrosine phosphatase
MIAIRPWLWVGRYVDTTNEIELAHAGIQAMLQLHDHAPHAAIETMFLPMQDGVPVSEAMLARGVDFIRKQHTAGHIVLVACSAGISRSVSLATAALKEEENLSLLDALHAVREQHPRAMPDHVHWEALCRYYGEDISFWDIWRETLD